MANRVIRDWTTSEIMDSVSLEAEVFFTRLIMKADDFGSYHANIKLLKAGLFPLKEVSRDQISKWMRECIKADLIFMYEVEGKGYIRIKNFGQRLRNMRNAFPHPIDNSQQVAATRGESVPDIEVEREEEVETELEGEDAHVPFVDENVPRGLDVTLPHKNELFEEIFSDARFVEELDRQFPKKNIQRAWEECWLFHSQKPSPPVHGWQWRQKLSTWLINTKDEPAKKTKGTDAINARREAFARKHGTGAGG